jgi:hypothetical protein
MVEIAVVFPLHLFPCLSSLGKMSSSCVNLLMKYAKDLGLTCYCFSKSVNDLRLTCYNFRMFVIYDLRLTCYCFRKFVNYLIITHFSLVSLLMIKVITKLPNSEQSYKGKVKTHNYINRQNQSTTGKL